MAEEVKVTPTEEQVTENNSNDNQGTETDFKALLEGVDLNKMMDYHPVKVMVQAMCDRRVQQALATDHAKREAAEQARRTEAKKLEQMTEEQRERYKFDQEKADFEAQKARFAHDQLVVETQKQMLAAGLPDLAAYITGSTAEETTANLSAVTKLLSTWKSEQLNRAMRGRAPHDTNPQDDKGRFLTAEDIKKMTPAEINAAWKAGKIDTRKL